MRRIVAIALLALSWPALASCAPAQPDQRQVQEWLDQRSDAAADATAHLGGLASERSGLSEMTEDDAVASGGYVRADFEDGAEVHAIEFSCFGAEVMDATVSVDLVAGDGSEHIVSGANDVRCDGETVAIDAAFAGHRVLAVTAGGASADGAGAWSVVVR